MEYYSLNGAITKAEELRKSDGKSYMVYTKDMIKYIVEELNNKQNIHIMFVIE